MLEGEGLIPCENFLQVLNSIGTWSDRIFRELLIDQEKPSPVQEWRDKLNRTIENLPNPDQPFGPDEASDWSKRLTDLTAKIERVAKDNEENKKDIRRLKAELIQLSSLVRNIPRKTWLRLTGNKVFGMLEKLASTKSGDFLIKTAIKGLLGEGTNGD